MFFLACPEHHGLLLIPAETNVAPAAALARRGGVNVAGMEV